MMRGASETLNCPLPTLVEPSCVDPRLSLRLDNQLCFALYAATHAMTRAYRTVLGELGLTYPQYLVLIVLFETNGMTVSALGERLHLDSGTLTPLLKRLAAAGLVLRQRRRADEREVEVSLTPAGAELEMKLADARSSLFCRVGLSERDISALRGDLTRLLATLEADAPA